MHPLSHLANGIMALIAAWGYAGILLWMTLESACIPIPSEVVLPFSGFLISQGKMAFLPAVTAATLGCALGSWLAYGVGAWGGRPAAERYGRWLLISRQDLDRGEAWFQRHGGLTVLLSRMLPVIRTFISLPVGVARMPWGRFTFYTVLGSLPWCWALIWAGWILGRRWTVLGGYFHRFDMAIAVALGAAVIFWIWLHWQRGRRNPVLEGHPHPDQSKAGLDS